MWAKVQVKQSPIQLKKTNCDFQKQTSSFKNKLRIPKSNSFFLKTKSVIRYKQISLIDRCPLLSFLHKSLLASMFIKRQCEHWKPTRAFSRYFRIKKFLNNRNNWLTPVRKPSALEISDFMVVVSFYLKMCVNSLCYREIYGRWPDVHRTCKKSDPRMEQASCDLM